MNSVVRLPLRCGSVSFGPASGAARRLEGPPKT
jgi:hypothetical protein